MIGNVATLVTCCYPIKLACSQLPNSVGSILLFTHYKENNHLKHPFPLCEWRSLTYSHYPASCKTAFQILQGCFVTEKKQNAFECLRSIMKYEWQKRMPQNNSNNSLSKWLLPPFSRLSQNEKDNNPQMLTVWMVPAINITITHKINKQTFCYLTILRVPDLKRTKQGIRHIIHKQDVCFRELYSSRQHFKVYRCL